MCGGRSVGRGVGGCLFLLVPEVQADEALLSSLCGFRGQSPQVLIARRMMAMKVHEI